MNKRSLWIGRLFSGVAVLFTGFLGGAVASHLREVAFREER